MTLREQIIEWNNRFPLDRWYRKKYGIGFGSSEHRQLSQVDIYLEWLEDEVYLEAEEEFKETDRKVKELEEGIWLREQAVKEEDEEALFSKMKTNFQ